MRGFPRILPRRSSSYEWRFSVDWVSSLHPGWHGDCKKLPAAQAASINHTTMKAILFLALPALLLTCSASAQHEEHHQPEKAAQNPMSQELAPLKGDPFSARFLKMMIAHHQSGIEMGDLVGERSEHHRGGIEMLALVEERTDRDPLEKFSKEGIEHQKKEIDDLEALKN